MTNKGNPIKIPIPHEQLPNLFPVIEKNLREKNDFANSLWISSIKFFLTIDTTLLFGSFAILDYADIHLHRLVPVAWGLLLLSILFWLMGTFEAIVFFRKKIDEGQKLLRLMVVRLKEQEPLEIEEENFIMYSSTWNFVLGILFSFWGIISLACGWAASVYPKWQRICVVGCIILDIVVLLWVIMQCKNIQKISNESKQIKI